MEGQRAELQFSKGIQQRVAEPKMTKREKAGKPAEKRGCSPCNPEKMDVAGVLQR